MTSFFSPHLATLLLAAAMVAGPAPAQAADAAVFESAAAEFMRASGGDETAIEPAADRLFKLSQAEPTDPVLRAYAGAAATLRSRTTLLPWKKMSHAEDGLALIDKALAQLTPAHDAPLYRGVPASLEARFTAASTFMALPSMFNRQARGAALLDDMLRSPLLESAPAGFKAAVWLQAGQEATKAKNHDEARRWLNKAASSGAPQAALAQARLKELP
jgi:hypothetical protein